MGITYLDVGQTFLIAIPPECMVVLLTVHVDVLPAKLLDSHKGLMDMVVLRYHIRSEVKRKTLGVQNMGRSLCKIWLQFPQVSLSSQSAWEAYDRLCSSLQLTRQSQDIVQCMT